MSGLVKNMLMILAMGFCVVIGSIVTMGLNPNLLTSQSEPAPENLGLPPEEIDWKENIAVIALKVEKELHSDYILCDLNRGFVNMSQNMQMLQRIWEKADKRIKVQSAYTEKEVIRIANSMHKILEEEGLEYRNFSSDEYYFHGANLFGYQLAKREIDCVAYSILGLSIAERLGLPISAIRIPGHFSLRWNFDQGEYLNLELCIPAKCKNEFYLSWKEISHESITNGVYLQNLTRKQVIAEQYYSLSLVWEKRLELEKALTSLDGALWLHKKFPDAYNLRGVVNKRKGLMIQALMDFDTAVALDSVFPEARQNRALLCSAFFN